MARVVPNGADVITISDAQEQFWAAHRPRYFHSRIPVFEPILFTPSHSALAPNSTMKISHARITRQNRTAGEALVFHDAAKWGA